jgi:cobalt/nickel transport system permease protein
VRLPLDDAAWNGAWRTRSTVEKTLLCGGLLVVAATSSGIGVSVLVLVATLCVALGPARVPARSYLLALAAPVGFVLVGGAAIAVTSTGAVAQVASAGPFAVTRASLLDAAEVVTRSVAAMAALTLLATTTPITDLLTGLRRLRVPEVVLDVAAVMYRMLFGLLDAVLGIAESQRARLGYVNGRTARRSAGMLAGAALQRAWLRSRRLEDGLAGRGYTGALITLASPRPVSVGFVVASTALVMSLAAVSLADAFGLLP